MIRFYFGTRSISLTFGMRSKDGRQMDLIRKRPDAFHFSRTLPMSFEQPEPDRPRGETEKLKAKW